MNKAELAAHSRAQLDKRFHELGPAKRYSPPVRGWIKAIREALGMSTAQLAHRLKIKQPSVVELEKSEAKGSIDRVCSAPCDSQRRDDGDAAHDHGSNRLEFQARARIRVNLRRIRVFAAEVVLDPFIHVAMHVAEPPGVRLLLAHRVGVHS